MNPSRPQLSPDPSEETRVFLMALLVRLWEQRDHVVVSRQPTENLWEAILGLLQKQSPTVFSFWEVESANYPLDPKGCSLWEHHKGGSYLYFQPKAEGSRLWSSRKWVRCGSHWFTVVEASFPSVGWHLDHREDTEETFPSAALCEEGLPFFRCSRHYPRSIPDWSYTELQGVAGTLLNRLGSALLQNVLAAPGESNKPRRL